MTAAPTSTCPAWCNLNDCNDGTHWHFVEPTDHIPADRSCVVNSDCETEFPSLPLFGANLRWRQSEGHGVEIVLHERERDGEWAFSLYGAFDLLTHILGAYVTAMDDLAEVPMPLSETWTKFRALSDRIAARLVEERAAALRGVGIEAEVS